MRVANRVTRADNSPTSHPEEPLMYRVLPALDAARAAAAQGPRRPAAQLQPRLLLLGRGPQRRRLPGPDRHRLPRRAVLLDGEPQGQGRALGEAPDLALRL